MKTVLNHLYDDWDLYRTCVGRTPTVIASEADEINEAAAWAARKLRRKKPMRAMEVFCGTGGSLYAPHYGQHIDLQVQLDILKTDATPATVTIGSVLDYRDPQPFDLIINGWDNIELLPHHTGPAYVRNMIENLGQRGIFLERAWAGLGQPAMAPRSFEFEVRARKDVWVDRFPTARYVRSSVDIENNLIEANFWYRQIDILDADRKVLHTWTCTKPIVLTNASAYGCLYAAAAVGAQCIPLFFDEDGQATDKQQPYLPTFFAFCKGLA